MIQTVLHQLNFLINEIMQTVLHQLNLIDVSKLRSLKIHIKGKS
jgi:hypothetical protein